VVVGVCIISNGMKTIVVVLVILVIVVVGGYYLMNNNTGVSQSPSPTVSVSVEPSPTELPISSETVSPSPTAMSQAKEFIVTGTAFKFSPAEIKVKKGDKVKIIFRNNGGTHDWVLDEFNVRTKQLQTGQTETVEFTADKTGTFEYYCSVGTHRQMGMKGKLIVE
jgi:plastocyanin